MNFVKDSFRSYEHDIAESYDQFICMKIRNFIKKYNGEYGITPLEVLEAMTMNPNTAHEGTGTVISIDTPNGVMAHIPFEFEIDDCVMIEQIRKNRERRRMVERCFREYEKWEEGYNETV